MIRIENLSKDLGEFFLRDVSLEINDGEYFMILGPTGAGKTILLETIAGIYMPDGGRILLDGRDITNSSPRERNISMVYQDYTLFPFLTVEENIGFGLKTRKTGKNEIRHRVDELANLMGVSHLLHRYPGSLSGGEQQRISIARALIMEPNVMLLDEPLSALDTQTTERLRDELKKIHSITKTTTIHVTHNFEEAFSLGDRIAIMNEGSIAQVGEPDDVFKKPNSEFMATFVNGNLFKGYSTVRGDIADIDINGITIQAITQKKGHIHIFIHPEDTLLSKKPMDSSARNTFKGEVVNISGRGILNLITIDAGIPFQTMITRRSCDEMSLHEGSKVYVFFKASKVHVI
ncbi:MAG: tungstate ABC transporter ATP-binding protein WtpC [Candidatus Altiarchaeota archaeon]|nr:tungstate ABC transporter ATP-binding protein WtpC [Candidatus Altiarchaeota archaeon]